MSTLFLFFCILSHYEFVYLVKVAKRQFPRNKDAFLYIKLQPIALSFVPSSSELLKAFPDSFS